MSDFWFCTVVCLFISLGSCLFEISSSALLANENNYFYTLILILSLTPHFFCIAFIIKALNVIKATFYFYAE